jgi:hypothetical protein
VTVFQRSKEIRFLPKVCTSIERRSETHQQRRSHFTLAALAIQTAFLQLESNVCDHLHAPNIVPVQYKSLFGTIETSTGFVGSIDSGSVGVPLNRASWYRYPEV